jgi:hypothetical protein
VAVFGSTEATASAKAVAEALPSPLKVYVVEKREDGLK